MNSLNETKAAFLHANYAYLRRSLISDKISKHSFMMSVCVLRVNQIFKNTTQTSSLGSSVIVSESEYECSVITD